jgi:hypothetical protein
MSKQQYKRLRRYSDDEIRQLVREVFLEQAATQISEEEARARWEGLPERNRLLLEVVTIGVYRRIWFAEEKAKEGETPAPQGG